jgi:hypothetical protein
MGAIVAVFIAADQRVIARFRADGATAPERAVRLDAMERLEQRRAEAMVRRGVLRQTPDGRLYLDEAALARGHGRRRAVVGALAAILILALAVILLIGVFG